MSDTEGDDGGARAYYVHPLPLYTMETQRVQLCTQQKLCCLEIAHRCHKYLEIGTQFRDSEIAQISKLCGTHICDTVSTVNSEVAEGTCLPSEGKAKCYY